VRRGLSVASSERASARLLAAALSGVEPTDVAELPEGVVVVETEGDVLVVLVDSPACAMPIRPNVAATARDRIVRFIGTSSRLVLLLVANSGDYACRRVVSPPQCLLRRRRISASAMPLTDAAGKTRLLGVPLTREWDPSGGGRAAA
jgi:hypothetical protein